MKREGLEGERTGFNPFFNARGKKDFQKVSVEYTPAAKPKKGQGLLFIGREGGKYGGTHKNLSHWRRGDWIRSASMPSLEEGKIFAKREKRKTPAHRSDLREKRKGGQSDCLPCREKRKDGIRKKHVRQSFSRRKRADSVSHIQMPPVRGKKL